MILSMSRWFATFCRKSYIVSRFINWDYSQSFHIKMAIIATFFATLHAIGHLTGTFLDGSRPERQGAVALLLGGDATPMSYGDYVWVASFRPSNKDYGADISFTAECTDAHCPDGLASPP